MLLFDSDHFIIKALASNIKVEHYLIEMEHEIDRGHLGDRCVDLSANEDLPANEGM